MGSYGTADPHPFTRHVCDLIAPSPAAPELFVFSKKQVIRVGRVPMLGQCSHAARVQSIGRTQHRTRTCFGRPGNRCEEKRGACYVELGPQVADTNSASLPCLGGTPSSHRHPQATMHDITSSVYKNQLLQRSSRCNHPLCDTGITCQRSKSLHRRRGQRVLLCGTPVSGSTLSSARPCR